MDKGKISSSNANNLSNDTKSKGERFWTQGNEGRGGGRESKKKNLEHHI